MTGTSVIEIDVEPNSEAWVLVRLGHFTASQTKMVVTPKRGELSTQRQRYQGQLLAEWALGRPYSEWAGDDSTERGHALQPDAAAYLEFQLDMESRTVGHIFRDATRTAGASPDMVFGPLGAIKAIVELKCPTDAGKHLVWLYQNQCPSEHWCQVQGQLWVTGVEKAIFMSYYPELPPLVVEVEPEEKFQAALDEHIPTFIEELEDGKKWLAEKGVVSALEEL